MTKKEKLLAAGAVVLLGSSYLYFTRKPKADPGADSNSDDAIIPSGGKTVIAPVPVPSPTALNFNLAFTKADKLYVQSMQRIIGVDDDGAWGPKTDTALKAKAPGIVQPFSLNQLQSYVKNVAAIGKFKKNQKVWAAIDHKVVITKSNGVIYTKLVKKGQYLGVISQVRNATYVIKNDFFETLISSPLLVMGSSLGNIGISSASALKYL